jgi:hypothetical protein
MVTDHYIKTWPDRDIFNQPQNPWPNFTPNQTPEANPNRPLVIDPGVSKEDFAAFKKEFEEFKQLVKRAIKYDEDNNEPHCEVDEKVEIIRKLAEQLGVTVDDIFPRD